MKIPYKLTYVEDVRLDGKTLVHSFVYEVVHEGRVYCCKWPSFHASGEISVRLTADYPYELGKAPNVELYAKSSDYDDAQYEADKVCTHCPGCGERFEPVEVERVRTRRVERALPPRVQSEWVPEGS